MKFESIQKIFQERFTLIILLVFLLVCSTAKGVPFDIPDRDDAEIHGRNALHMASMNGHEEIVGLLLDDGRINVNQNDDRNQTALHLASMNGHEEVVGLLLNRSDINVNQRDFQGRAAIHHAAINGSRAIVQLLLDHPDTQPYLADNLGRTALDHAMEQVINADIRN